jgi:hypothetical protein
MIAYALVQCRDEKNQRLIDGNRFLGVEMPSPFAETFGGSGCVEVDGSHEHDPANLGI